MKTHLFWVPLGLLILTIVTPAQERVKQARLEGLDISMTLKKRSPTPQQSDWPVEPVTVTAQSVPTGGKTIHELLRANHIFPDVEAFSVVYALNPQVQALSDLTATQLRLPVVQGGAKLAAAFNNGFTVFLTVDKELKERFDANVKKLSALVQTVSTFRTEKFQSEASRNETVTSLRNISETLNRINDRLIQRYGRPISTEALGQLNAEVALLNRMLGDKASPGALISKVDQDRINAVKQDLDVKKRAYIEVAAGGAPDRWPDVTITVKTLKGGREIAGLRIYYAPIALKDEDSEIHPFGTLSSPTSKTLSTAYYCFWGAKDPTKEAVTNEVCLDIGASKEENVDLTVIR
jgi:hypothetical protein